MKKRINKILIEINVPNKIMKKYNCHKIGKINRKAIFVYSKNIIEIDKCAWE
jgi:hypothetical protein